MTLDEQLKELSFQMMLNEMQKLQIENSYLWNKKNNTTTLPNSTKEQYHRSIIQADKKGYELSLQFNQLLLENGYGHNAFKDGPDATQISTENLLARHGLEYPITWYVQSEDRDGLHFGYDSKETIDRKHEEYLKNVEAKFEKGNIDKETRERIIIASEYYRSQRYLKTQYQTSKMRYGNSNTR